MIEALKTIYFDPAVPLEVQHQVTTANPQAYLERQPPYIVALAPTGEFANLFALLDSLTDDILGRFTQHHLREQTKHALDTYDTEKLIAYEHAVSDLRQTVLQHTGLEYLFLEAFEKDPAAYCKKYLPAYSSDVCDVTTFLTFFKNNPHAVAPFKRQMCAELPAPRIVFAAIRDETDVWLFKRYVKAQLAALTVENASDVLFDIADLQLSFVTCLEIKTCISGKVYPNTAFTGKHDFIRRYLTDMLLPMADAAELYAHVATQLHHLREIVRDTASYSAAEVLANIVPGTSDTELFMYLYQANRSSKLLWYVFCSIYTECTDYEVAERLYLTPNADLKQKLDGFTFNDIRVECVTECTLARLVRGFVLQIFPVMSADEKRGFAKKFIEILA